jgi:hypothetical protein
MCEDFAPNFGDKKNGCCITTEHHLILPFSPGNFWPKTSLLPHPTLLFCFPEKQKQKLHGLSLRANYTD